MLRTAGGLTINNTTTFAGKYGSFYSSTTQSDGVNTPTLLYCENTADNDGVTMELGTSGKKSRMTFANAGTYNIQFSAQAHHQGGGGSGSTINIWFRLNGADIANSDTKITIASSSPYQVAAWNFIVSVAAGQYVEMVYASDNANVEFLAEASATSPFAHPAIPSIIMTAQQIK
jgi:hypothetical protein